MTHHAPIEKMLRPGTPAPNLLDYADACARFRWEDARRELAGPYDRGGLNMAYAAVDRHVAGGRGDHLALRLLGRDGSRRDLTYSELARADGALRQPAAAPDGVGPAQ